MHARTHSDMRAHAHTLNLAHTHSTLSCSINRTAFNLVVNDLTSPCSHGPHPGIANQTQSPRVSILKAPNLSSFVVIIVIIIIFIVGGLPFPSVEVEVALGFFCALFFV